MHKIFPITALLLILAQQVQGQVKHRTLRHQAPDFTSKLPGKQNDLPHINDKNSLFHLINHLKTSKFLLKIYRAGLSRVIKVDIEPFANIPFAVYLIDQHHFVHFRQRYVNVSATSITLYAKQAPQKMTYSLHVISASQHIKKAIAIN